MGGYILFRPSICHGLLPADFTDQKL
jgi:hypothetical protein